MNDNKKKQLLTIIDTVCKLVSATPEQQKHVEEVYLAYDDCNLVISDLMVDITNALGNNKQMYDYSLELLRNLDPDKYKNIDEMKKKTNEIVSNNIKKGNMSLEENHNLVKSSLKMLCDKLNEKEIDYYVVGALPCFIATGTELFRYHDDIDIMVNEEDIQKVEESLENTDYQFSDMRFDSPKTFDSREQRPAGNHEVVANNKKNEFHIGFFCFRREQDNSIIAREYYTDYEQGTKVSKVMERPSTPELTSLQYNEIPIIYNGTQFKTGSLESVYNIKKYTQRPKDQTDVKVIEPFVDKNKVETLKKLSQQLEPNRFMYSSDTPTQSKQI